jgi:uncharacterized protein YjbI with pentapeptide repeats
MSRLKNNFSIPVVWVLIFVVVGGSYWLLLQKSQIEPFAKQIDSIKVNQNSPIGMKDYILMKRELITSQNTLNNSVFQFFSTLFLFFTAYTAWRNLVVSEKKQVAEIFAKAVDQLGSNELGSRVGGIFALEQIAQSSPENHWTVIEVLISYIRDQSRKENSTFKPEYKAKENHSDQNKIEERLQKIMAEEAISVTIDIQAALTVICRRNSKQDPQDRVIDLSSCDIRGANIKNANLGHADLRGAKISGANLENANLSSAKLQGTDFRRSVLNGANLNKSSLNHALLQEASLEKTDLQDSDLTNADLQAANLKDAKLNRATLHYSNFREAELQGANLSQAKLQRTDLKIAKIDHTTKLDEKWKRVHQINISGGREQVFDEVDFSDAVLINANFERCSLNKAIFSGADLEGANFKNAHLEGAIFRSQNAGLNLKKAEFNGAYLKGAVFQNADLQYTDFTESTRITDIREVVFEEVNLANANFENVRLEKARFINNSLLNSTRFCKAKLKEAVFEYCYYNKETSFQEADLDNATFTGNIKGADFRNSNHKKANFKDADISLAQF